MMHRTRRARAYLPMREVLRIADEVAREQGLQAVKPQQRQRALREESEILRCLTMREALPVELFPIVNENATGTLWVDSQYVAYQIGSGDVRYVYVTLYHIEEERITGKLPQDIAQEFMKARRCMTKAHRKYHVARKYEREAAYDGDSAAGHAYSGI